MKKYPFLYFLLLSGFILSTFEIKSQINPGYKPVVQNNKIKAYRKIDEQQVKYALLAEYAIKFDQAANKILESNQFQKGIMDILYQNILQGKLKAYSADNDHLLILSDTLNSEKLKERLGEQKVLVVKSDTSGNLMEELVIIPHKPEEIRELLIRKLEFYNEKNQVTAERIVAICPVRHFNQEIDNSENLQKLRLKIAWFYYPALRLIFNSRQITKKVNLDDFFINKQYTAEKTKYYFNSPVTEDEYVTDFKLPVLKAMALKEAMQNKEQKQVIYQETINKLSPVYPVFPEIKAISCARFNYYLSDLTQGTDSLLLYPEFTLTEKGNGRFADILMKQILHGKIKLYTNEFDYGVFTRFFSVEEAKIQFGEEKIMVNELVDMLDYIHEYIREANTAEIKQVMIKELAFYDKSGNILYQYPFALGFKRIYMHIDEPAKKKVGWVHYKDLVPMLFENYIFNPADKTTINLYDYFTGKKGGFKPLNYYLLEPLHWDNDTSGIAMHSFPLEINQGLELAKKIIPENPQNLQGYQYIHQWENQDQSVDHLTKTTKRRIIDFSLPENTPLYLPTDTMNHFISFSRLIYKLLNQGLIDAYDIENRNRLDLQQVDQRLGKQVVSILVEDPETLDLKEVEIQIDPDLPSIISLTLVINDYSDASGKNVYSEIESIIPVRKNFNDETMQSEFGPVFSLDYKQLEPYLKKNFVFRFDKFVQTSMHDFFHEIINR
jgi:hypothetical protein